MEESHSPSGVEWYLADIVMELRTEGAATSQVWVNTHLIRADSPEEAFEKAEKLGKEHMLGDAASYVNALGNKVEFIYRGLGTLVDIPDKLEDGVELVWNKYEDQTPEEILEFIASKEELSVFSPIQEETDPRYVPWELRDKK